MLDANKLQQAVDQAYTQFHSLNGGQNADYIPFLANVPGQLAAVAIVTCDGNVYSAGDSDYRFALESISTYRRNHAGTQVCIKKSQAW